MNKHLKSVENDSPTSTSNFNHVIFNRMVPLTQNWCNPNDVTLNHGDSQKGKYRAEYY